MIVINYTYASSPKKRFVSKENSLLIGRAAPGQPVDLDLSPDNSVSRNHARLTYENEAYWIEDLESKSGTWVNGQQISLKTRLSSGDELRLGLTSLKIFVPTEGILTDSISATVSTLDLLLTQKSDTAEALDAARQRLAAFYEMGELFGTAESMERLFKTVIHHLCQTIPDAQRGVLILQVGDDLLPRAHTPEDLQPPISMNLAKRAIERQEAFTWRYGSGGVTDDLYDSVILHGTQAAMYAPLIWKGEVLGVVFVDNVKLRKAFNDEDLRLLMAMAQQVAMFIKNHALQQELRHEEIVRSNLLRQFSPQVADRLQQLLRNRPHLHLGGERAEPVTILNSDIRGFTALTQDMEPSEVVAMLNELFGVCLPIIFKYKGTVDKFVGDGILAVFGSPESDEQQWENAVRAALEMQAAIRQVGRERAARGLAVCDVGIGIHTGAVLHGFIGSEERMEYTVIGDAVNRVTRYCNGAGPGEVVISQAVHERVGDLVEAVPTLIRSKHPDTEADLEAYLVTGLDASQKITVQNG